MNQMSKDQAMTFELLMILAVVLVLVSPVGKWLNMLITEITTYHKVNLSFNPLNQGPSTIGTSGTSGTSGSGNSGVVHGFNIPLEGGGSVTVNSTTLAGAQENAKQETGINPA